MNKPTNRTLVSQSSSQSSTFLTPADVQLPSSARSVSELPTIDNLSDSARCELAYSLSQSNREPFSSLKLTDLQCEQLQISENQTHLGERSNNTRSENTSNITTTHMDTAPLPRTLADALRPSQRAIVITEAQAPYRVVNVNDAWVDLCGYTKLESKGRELKDLLQGPATDPSATTALMHQLLHGEEVGTTLTNYKKSGRSFQNRLRAGPLLAADKRVTHFVGVLQELPSEPNANQQKQYC